MAIPGKCVPTGRIALNVGGITLGHESRLGGKGSSRESGVKTLRFMGYGVMSYAIVDTIAMS